MHIKAAPFFPEFLSIRKEMGIKLRSLKRDHQVKRGFCRI